MSAPTNPNGVGATHSHAAREVVAPVAESLGGGQDAPTHAFAGRAVADEDAPRSRKERTIPLRTTRRSQGGANVTDRFKQQLGCNAGKT